MKALNALGKAAALLPEDPDVLYHFAVVLDQQGKKPEARQYLEKALGISKDFPGAGQAEKLLQKLPATTKK
jgi:tetratricopeptide (TPR) repeat protein